MFAALFACRVTLQGYVALVEDARQQQIIADIIGVLDSVERLQPKIGEPGTTDLIDADKRQILGLLKSLSEASGLRYSIPRNLIETTFGAWRKPSSHLLTMKPKWPNRAV